MTQVDGRRIWVSRTVALVVAGAVFNVERVEAPAPAATTYIGTLHAEPPARVAIVVEGDTFLAYACGKTDDFNQAASAWFKGTVQKGRIEAAVDGKKLAASLGEGIIRGTLTTDRRDREFIAKPVPPNAIAGLYRATKDVKGDSLVMGWIVDAKHRVVGGARASTASRRAATARALPPPLPANQIRRPNKCNRRRILILVQVDEAGGRGAGREGDLRGQAARGQGRPQEPEEVTRRVAMSGRV